MAAERSIRTIARDNAKRLEDAAAARRKGRLIPQATPQRAQALHDGKPITVDAVHPNQGVESAYRKKLDRLIDEMNASIDYWIKAAYRANEPRMAQDEAPALSINRTMGGLSKKWQKRFDDFAKPAAETFAKQAKEHTDRAYAEKLKKAGFTVEMNLTPEINDILQATIAENVSLIKSIASQNLASVEGLVMRSVQRGRDLGSLSAALQKQFGVTKRRAAFISLDQNNKASSAITSARQIQFGVEATWQHTGAGKHHRPEHVAASGKKYDPKKGMFLEGKWVWPGSEPGCRCLSKSVISTFN